ncbi:MAG: tRNA (adenosine(37)-N6)-threonylcarbamoyltransferase complex transferase subunit TsaD [Clostridiales bacterium]|nr:tRNA (adenosine(37)-N6)-threonylcarbamoyltransferase complex transferase subunit TsaD [Clostridiales bacterium]
MSTYLHRARLQAECLAGRQGVRILAIETSCDETAAAIVEDGCRELANAVYSQIDLHTLYGGVVPEIASRAHVEKIDAVLQQALQQAGLTLQQVDAIAVTQGPGLVGALLVGVSYAKGLAYAMEKPLIAVNHIEGHICANYLTSPGLQPPFACLVVSGGHSHLMMVDKKDGYHLIGCTQDDAAGEAFDKAARVLGLAYPGGPRLDALAEEGDAHRFTLPRPHTEGRYDYSFSGLKTAFINLVHGIKQRGEPLPVADLAASFRRAVVDQLMDKALLALNERGETMLALAGGVSANRLLRRRMQAICNERGIKLYLPELKYCGDNAAMVAAAAHVRLRHGQVAGLSLNADPALRLV